MLLLSFFVQLESTAMDSMSQTLDFTQEMNQALPCAFDGVALEECSSANSTTMDTDALLAYQELLQNITQELERRLPQE
jgi:hypothetical protein